MAAAHTLHRSQQCRSTPQRKSNPLSPPFEHATAAGASQRRVRCTKHTSPKHVLRPKALPEHPQNQRHLRAAGHCPAYAPPVFASVHHNLRRRGLRQTSCQTRVALWVGSPPFPLLLHEAIGRLPPASPKHHPSQLLRAKSLLSIGCTASHAQCAWEPSSPGVGRVHHHRCS